MREFPGLVLPSYHEHNAAPVKLLRTGDGGIEAWRASSRDGAWEPANHMIDEILFARAGDSFTLTVEEFVDRTEWWRARYSVADGAIAALYETVEAIRDVARAEERPLTDAETSLVRGIQRRTYRMFEEKLRAEGNPAADPDLLEREGNRP